jgi:DNA-binding NtrC family response regulator
MSEQTHVLIVSDRMAHVKALLGILNTLPINVYVASTLKQAKSVLSSQAFAVVFCDERMPGGSYRELLGVPASAHDGRRSQLVVTLQTGEWDEYLEAIDSGAFEAIRCPVEPNEVVTALMHATRNRLQTATSRALQMTA